ncbi:MAG: tyrosine--tRNA ligase [Flammeovirgaceae bacterium]|nr:tyrosine--tRNA ligase [Flammeovirgaceae bacterium]|tara:strand:+ start:2910 stop:4193 length:1284 start_codon:yes stop_codon:yes gene_type:complete
MTDFLAELTWRGMVQDKMPNVDTQLKKEMTSAYIGFDPTADSLHIGNLVQIMSLVHLQRCGHKPFALVGGATGMVGDPSGKSNERNLLNEATINNNIHGVTAQLKKFLKFDGDNAAEVVNNQDWFKKFQFLDFIRDVGKHVSINYMLAKDSVKSRLDTGMSFTEFCYQLVQGYDFYWLWKNKNIKIQMGGSDQWGNIVTGTELIRRKGQGEAFAITTPLITKADGTKFGKSEGGNIWLDPKKTTPYKFYQYWINSSDEDVVTYIKIFSIKSRKEIEKLIREHQENQHLRLLQNSLAEEITERVHSKSDLEMAKKASQILFGKSTQEDLSTLNEEWLLQVLEGIPKVILSRKVYESLSSVIELLTEATKGLIFASKGEARRLIEGGGVSINKHKINSSDTPVNFTLLNKKYILAQKGKKNYYLVIVED